MVLRRRELVWRGNPRRRHGLGRFRLARSLLSFGQSLSVFLILASSAESLHPSSRTHDDGEELHMVTVAHPSDNRTSLEIDQDL